ncbi:MAG TPA: methyl-accepting chemotaxis protein [Syntrophorhabdaceae bacterium]|nr:methyl-accepting chemotaxis protein [Syntrophorhabdaceae bacterium]
MDMMTVITCAEAVDGHNTDEQNESARKFAAASAGDLRALNVSTENDFLSIGSYLQKLSSQAISISKAAGSVAKMVGSEEAVASTDRLRDAEACIGTYLEKSQGRFTYTSDSMLHIIRLMDAVYTPLSTFKSIVKHLHMLGISTRIEDARVNSDGRFDTLSKHVEKLSVMIASRADAIVKAIVSLQEIMKQSRPQVDSARDMMSIRAQSMLNRIKSGLSMFLEKGELSSQTAISLAANSEQVASNISRVISSLQFQDITRQQIEHVVDLFDEVASEIVVPRDIVAILADTGPVQIDQLEHARKEMGSAVATIINGLEAIARNLWSMLRETEKLTGIAGNAHSSFLADINYSVSFVVGSLEENREADEQLARAVGDLSDSIQNVSAHVDDIEEISSEIELIAINAQIRAAHMAENGGALGVLAEAIRNLSETTSKQTLAITSALESVREASVSLSAESQRNGNGEDILAMRTEIDSVLDFLGESQQTLSSLLTQLKKETSELTEAIQTVIKSVSAHTRTDEVVGKIIKDFRNIVEGRKVEVGLATPTNGDYLTRLAERYTMQQERTVHQARLAGTNDSPSLKEDHFLDNVELF